MFLGRCNYQGLGRISSGERVAACLTHKIVSPKEASSRCSFVCGFHFDSGAFAFLSSIGFSLPRYEGACISRFVLLVTKMTD